MQSRYGRTTLVALVTLLATFAASLASAPQALAQAPTSFSCATGGIYGLDQGNGNLRLVNLGTTPTTTNIGTIAASTDNPNGLALPSGGGRYIYAVQNGSPNAGRVFRFDIQTGITQTFAAPAGISTSAGIPMGGINPANGFYYFATLSSGTMTLYAFNTTTNAVVGAVATISVAGGNGDLAFDSLGNLYFAADTGLYRVPGPIPTTAGSTTLTTTRLATLPSNSNGIAFDGDGTLYLGSSGNFTQVDPATGTTIRTFSTAPGFTPTDLASCANPNTIRAQKDLPTGRVAAGDQFTLTITGGGVTQGNTATTTGTDTGLQNTAAETAGPVLGRTGTTYTVTETPAGGASLANYTITWSCVNTANGNAVVNSGTGATAQFTMPSGTSGNDILCTFRNEAPAPKTIRLQKDLPNGRAAVTDQFALAITGPGVTGGNTATTAGSDFGVQGTAAETAGPVTGTPGTTYTITETAAGSTNLSTYTTTWRCVDASNGNAQIASGSGTTGQFTMPSGAGDILCTFRNDQPPITLSCETGTIYALHSLFPQIGKVNTATGAQAPIVNFPSSTGTNQANALAIPMGGGRYAYAIAFGGPDRGTVQRVDVQTGTYQAFPTPFTGVTGGGGFVAGAFDPVSGLYYFGRSSGGQFQVYAFDTTTNTYLGQVAAISVSGDNIGDFAFDSLGNMYLVAGTSLFRVGRVPTAAGTTVITPTLLATLPAASNGVAFDGDGTLHIANGTNYRQVDPGTGATLRTYSSYGGSDLASCAVPNTIRAQKELPSGRFAPGDQFTVTITGGGIAAGNVATTTGTDGGVQNTPEETAGPVLGLRGTVYTVTETAAAGADLDNYTSTWSCVDTRANNAVVANGSGTTGQFTMPAGSTSHDILCTFRNEPRDASLTLDKQAGSIVDLDGNGADPGDRIAYTFIVRNTGNVRFDTVAINDPKVGAVTCPAGALAPGASVTCGPADYTITQADILAGSVDNTATATGTPPGNGPPVTSPPDSTSTPTPARPAIELDKRAGDLVDADANGPDAGDTIHFTFVVTNAGNVPLNPVRVSDPKVGTVSCPAGALAPAATVSCTSTPYVLTQADIDRGAVANTAVATGTPPSGPDVTDEDSTNTPVAAGPALELAKLAGSLTDADGNGLASAGDTIAYRFEVTNRGNVTLNPVSVADPKVGPVACPAGPLAPGATVTCGPVTYTLVQADINAGRVVNTATATGTPPVGPPVTDEDTTTTLVPPAPAVDLDKRAGTLTDSDGNGNASAGDTIAYRFTVTNRGNVPLDPVTVSDPKVGPVTCPAGALAPGASVDCGPATYTLTQADVNAGSVVNRAVATGTPPSGPPVTDEDETTTPLPAVPNLRLDKTAGAVRDTNNSGLEDAGDTITYSFRVTNTGNVTLTDIAVADPKVGAVTCPVAPLAPGASVNCSDVDYTVTAADTTPPAVGVAPGVLNVATATGLDPKGTQVSDDDSLFTAVPSVPAIRIDKRAGRVEDTNNSGGLDAGDRIAYTFIVTNAGNQPLDQIAVADPKVGAVPCPSGTLAIGAEVTCGPVDYTVTQADILAGSVSNTARATGTPPGGQPPVESPPDTTNTPTPAAPAISLDKRAGTLTDADRNGIASAGDTIDYSFVVTNTGNVPLNPALVRDPKVGAVDCPAGALAPRASVTCSAAPYTITQADVNAGSVTNTATAIGTPPSGPDVEDTDTTTTPVPGAPSLRLVKEAGAVEDLDDNGIDAGDTIEYTFEVTNTGNLALDPVTVADPKAGPVTCPAGALGPGAKVTCGPVSYTLTQADINAGEVENTATATGTPPNGPPVTDEDTVTTKTPARPALRLVKQAGAITDGDGNGPDAGDTIAYTFEVTNTGNVPLEPVTVSDPKVGAVSCPAGALAPGATVACGPATYALTQADVAAGSVVNTATATGKPPVGPDVTDEDTVTTQVPGGPRITLDKRAGIVFDGDDNGIDAGDTIAYTFEVTNSGNLPLTAIAVSDPKLGPVTCPLTTLAPGESIVCGPFTYKVTAADVRAGEVVNRATASGKPPVGTTEVTSDDTVTTDLAPPTAAAKGRLTLDKRAGDLVDVDDNGPDAGDTIEYTFVVSNVGKVEVRDIAVRDPKLKRVRCPQRSLDAGKSMTCTAPPYRITAAEAAAGRVENSATVEGQNVAGSRAEGDESDAVTRFKPRLAALRVDKRAAARTARAGDLMWFRIRVRNVGSAPAKAVRVCDVLPVGMTVDRADRGSFEAGRWCFKRLAVLKPGASRTWRIRVRMDRDLEQATRMINRAVASAPGLRDRADAAAVRVRPAPLPTEDGSVVTG